MIISVCNFICIVERPSASHDVIQFGDIVVMFKKKSVYMYIYIIYLPKMSDLIMTQRILSSLIGHCSWTLDSINAFWQYDHSGI